MASMFLGIFSLTFSSEHFSVKSLLTKQSVFVRLYERARVIFEIIWVSLALFLTLPLALLWVCLALFWVILALLWHFFGWWNDPFWSWRSISFSMGLPRIACAFVSTLSVPEGKQLFMIFNQASHHQKQRAKRPRKSKPIPKFSRQPPRFHGCFAFILAKEYRRPSSNAGLHTFDVVERWI